MKIIIENVSKTFIKDKEKLNVLKNLSVTFESGKLYAIVGKSGAGKSTFLKCLAALNKADSGSIYFDDIEINKLNDKEISRFRNEKIGIVFQEFNLLEFLNTYENIALPLVINGKYKLEDVELKGKVGKLLEFVDLSDRNKHYPKELSGGEQQRIAIARSLINDPNVIFADEPTGSIDKGNSTNILKLLKKISKDKCVIIVTHDDNVLKYADEIYNLKNGCLGKYESKK